MLVEQPYGLRFDIYERVHLSDDVVGIDELEEIELFPEIQVVPGEEYATLRGHLLLSGLYRGEGETRELKHWIPVEITIPLSRVNRLEDIAVEIDNFDVDLLNERSLNITGILSLQGIETADNTFEAGGWHNQEFTASYEQQEDRIESIVADYSNEGLQEEEEILYEEDLSSYYNRESSYVTNDAENTSTDVWTDKDSVNEVSEVTEEISSFTRPDVHDREEVVLSSQITSNEEYVSDDQAITTFASLNNENDTQQRPPEEKSPSVAFGSKKNNELEREDSVGITKLLQSSHQVKQLELSLQAAAEKLNVAEQAENVHEEVRWNDLFVGKAEELTPFRKLKMVIVQRTETLDDIALRYQLSSRELQLYNRLTEQDISEGQVLYIP